MLRTRLWMGALLIGLMTGVLLIDRPPAFLFLLALIAIVGLLAAVEMSRLLAVWGVRPWLLGGAVLILLLANWPPRLWPACGPWWAGILGVYVAMVLATMLVEMATFVEPGSGVMRVALTVWSVAYVGLLPCFLIQLRWLKPEDPSQGTVAIVLAVFVPKCCDIGAYFTGRLLGRHPMSPVLSPKKTWEGLAGGLVFAALVAVLVNRCKPGAPLPGDFMAAAFGLAVGSVAVLGDLAESFIKRDSRRKDASQVVPGFGGVLDVIDSILFAAPVAYVWLNWVS